MKTAYATPEMKIDLIDTKDFFTFRSEGDPGIGELPGIENFPGTFVTSVEPFVDETIQSEVSEMPFVPDTGTPEGDPGIDLGVPQIGVPVFTLDPVGEITDPVSDVISGGDTGVSE